MSTFTGVLDRAAPVYIAGHRGLAGSALLRRFQSEGSPILWCAHTGNST
ncbi:gsbB domain protein [Mycobacterium kansasii 662]|uniref:GsbB domain protein n=1 Tax=Mycobacterium kansasii 662 TaxID=1299326 RepID=X7XR66_MYCKA|nr:gsbB domain protein [Mycobacterium kansasii 662]